MTTSHNHQGLFLVLEGADGSGKSAVATELVTLGRDAGLDIRRVLRGSPRGDEAHASLIRTVGRLFAESDEIGARWDLLSLAAATQCLALLQTEVEDSVLAGGVVIAESWWHKTQVRLAIEASICGYLDPSQELAFSTWQQGLMPSSTKLSQAQQMTVLIDTDLDTRVKWYEAGGCVEPVYDPQGAVTRDPIHFGNFTERIAIGLRRRAQEEGWPTIRNGIERQPVELARELIELILTRPIIE